MRARVRCAHVVRGSGVGAIMTALCPPPPLQEFEIPSVSSICRMLSPEASRLLVRDGAAAFYFGEPRAAVRRGGDTLSRASALMRAAVEGLFNALCATPRTADSRAVLASSDHRNAWMNQFCEEFHKDYCVTGTTSDAEVGRTLLRAVQAVYEGAPRGSLLRLTMLGLLRTRVDDGTARPGSAQTLATLQGTATRAAGAFQVWHITEHMFAAGYLHAGALVQGRFPVRLVIKRALLSLCPAAGAPPGLGEGAGAGAPDVAMAPAAAGARAAPPASARGRRRAREAPAAAGNGGDGEAPGDAKHPRLS